MDQPSNTNQDAASAASSPATNEAGTIEVENLDTFVKLLAGWHNRKVARMEHYLTLPDGQVMQIGEQPEFAVTGDIRKGFELGINMALMEFGVLPFSVESEDAPEAAPVEANAG